MIKVTYIDHMGSDLSVVNAARVSFGKKSEMVCTDLQVGTWELKPQDTKLIRYLAREKHYSPFNHTFVTFHVKAPVFVARQLVKHEYMPWNEISRRYVDEEPEFYQPDAWRGRSEDKKQGSEGTIPLEYIDAYNLKHIKDYWHETVGPDLGIEYKEGDHVPEFSLSQEVDYLNSEEALSTYRSLLKVGVCPEQARMVLPQSTMTEWYWSGTMKAVHKMCSLRCKPDTQLETQIVANHIDEEMAKLFPISWEALRAYEE
jgi:thymidylate synthase (FAD)